MSDIEISNEYVLSNGWIATLESSKLLFTEVQLEHAAKYIAILKDMNIGHTYIDTIKNVVTFKLDNVTEAQDKELGERFFDAIDCHCFKCEYWRVYGKMPPTELL